MPNFVDYCCRNLTRSSRALAIVLLSCGILLFILLGIARTQLARMHDQLVPRLQQELRQTLGRDVRIGQVRLQGMNSLLISDAAIARGDSFASGTAVTAPQTRATVNLLSLLLHRGKNPVSAIRSITFVDPHVTLRRTATGRWDFQDVLDRIGRQPMGAGVLRASFIVDDGHVSYQDAYGFGTGKAIRQQLANVDGRFSTPGRGRYAFTVSGDDTKKQLGTVKLAGTYTADAGVTEMRVTASDLAVKEFAHYLPNDLPITFENGTAALRLSALFRTLPRPETVRRQTTTELTAELDLSGVGLRLRELTSPIMATSGRLRLVHDRSRYPQGSRLELIGVTAHANDIPITLSGTIRDLNLHDLAHLNPYFDLRMRLATRQGEAIRALFPSRDWPSRIHPAGAFALDARVSGRPADLRIDGNMRGDRVAVDDITANGVRAAFHLRPAGSTQNAPTLQSTWQLRQVDWEDMAFSHLDIALDSATPWEKLETALQVTGSVKAGAARLPWGEARDVTSRFTGTRDGVTLAGLHTEMFGGTIDGSIAIPFQSSAHPTRQPLRATASFTGVNLARLAGMLSLRDLSGTGDGTLTLEDQPDGTLQVETSVRGKDVRFRSYLAKTLSGTFEAAIKDRAVTLAIPAAVAHTEYGVFTTKDGSYTRRGDSTDTGQLHLPLQGEAIALQRFGVKDLTGTGTLEGTLSGTITQPELNASVVAHDGLIMGRAYQQATSDLHLHGKSLRLRNLVVARPGITMTIPGGPEGLDPRAGIDGVRGTMQMHGVTLDEVLGLFEQKSPWQIDGGIDGTFGFTVHEGTLHGDGLAAIPAAVVHIPVGNRTQTLRMDRLALDFALDGRALTVRELSAQRGDSTIVAHGSAVCNPRDTGTSVDLAFQGSPAFLQDMPRDLLGIPVELTGPAEIAGTLKGPLDGSAPLVTDVTVQSSALRAEGIPLGTGSVALTYRYSPTGRELTIHRGAIENAAFRASTEGRFDLASRRMQDVRVNVTRIDLHQLPSLLAEADGDGRFADYLPVLSGMLADIAGQGQASVTANGTFSKPAVAVELDFTRLALGTTPLPNLRARLSSEATLGRYTLRIDEAVLAGGQGEGHASVTGTVDPDGQLRLHYAAREITPRLLATWTGEDYPLDGAISLTGDVTGTVKQPVIDGDLTVAQPVIHDVPLERIAAHLHLDTRALSVTDGTIAVRPGSQPITLQGTLPVRWDAERPSIDRHRPLSLKVALPRQSLSVLGGLAPDIAQTMSGEIEGKLEVGGTLDAPRLTEGHLRVDGSAALPEWDASYPNRVSNLDLRVRVASDRHTSRLTIERLSGTLDRVRGGQPVKGFAAGWIASEGDIRIPTESLLAPDRWQWDLQAKVIRLPLSQQLFMVNQASGFLRLQTQQDGQPLLTGVMYVENAEIKEPSTSVSSTPSWGPFEMNPRLSLVIQVGDGVRLSKSIFRIPLKTTPLPRPSVPEIIPGLQPSLAVEPTNAAYAYNASMLNAGTAAELPGTWAVVTGSLNDPRLYARFEVDKGKLSFPLNLIGSIRHARGHVTYSLADGPRIVMGIPEFPTETATPSATPAQPVSAAQPMP